VRRRTPHTPTGEEEAARASLRVIADDPVRPVATSEVPSEPGIPGVACANLDAIDAPGATRLLDFGATTVGVAARRTFRIRNCARRVNLEVTSITLGDGSGAFELDAPMQPVTLAPLDAQEVSVTFTPSSEDASRALLRVEAAMSDSAALALEARGTPNSCPTAEFVAALRGGDDAGGPFRGQVEMRPARHISFDAAESVDPDGMVARYAWAMVKRPRESSTDFEPNAKLGTSSPYTGFFVDAVGEYVVELSVTDDAGTESCEAARMRITAQPTEGIYVQLTWETPGDGDLSDRAGADLDLHYLHPMGRWDAEPYDIFWRNPTADWGIPGDDSDDPELEVDSSDRGPESVGHDRPEFGLVYSVGVHQFSDSGFGPSFATLRIFLRGELAFERRGERLDEVDEFWDVGGIVWPSGQFILKDRKLARFPGH